MSVCSEMHTERVNVRCEQKVEFSFNTPACGTQSDN